MNPRSERTRGRDRRRNPEPNNRRRTNQQSAPVNQLRHNNTLPNNNQIYPIENLATVLNRNNTTGQTNNNRNRTINQFEQNVPELQDEESYEYISEDDEIGEPVQVKGQPVTIQKTNIHFKRKNVDGEVDFSIVQIEKSLAKKDSKPKSNAKPTPIFPSMKNIDLNAIRPVRINKEKIKVPEPKKNDNIDITMNKQKKLRRVPKKNEMSTKQALEKSVKTPKKRLDSSFESKRTAKRQRPSNASKMQSNITSVKNIKPLNESTVISQCIGAPSHCSITLCNDGSTKDLSNNNISIRPNKRMKPKQALTNRNSTFKQKGNKKAISMTNSDSMDNSLKSEQIEESSVIDHEIIDDSADSSDE